LFKKPMLPLRLRKSSRSLRSRSGGTRSCLKELEGIVVKIKGLVSGSQNISLLQRLLSTY
ncbi:MAG: hypothetical protein NZ992_05210, partial [Candidatus Korarchaeum sp.]|nr:hypothetical protein [Candidatus Korarchaeum sp.]